MLGETFKRYDLRHEYEPSKPKIKYVKGKPVVRDPLDIRGLILHQTAVNYGVSARQIRLSGGDRDLALARRGLKVKAHGTSFRNGVYVISTPLLMYVQGGNGFNPDGINLEIEGNYPGLPDDPSTVPVREDKKTTWGGNPTEWTELAMLTARALVRDVVALAFEEGCRNLEYIWAHRQSNGGKPADPGYQIWQDVAEWAAAYFGLKLDYEHTRGTGKPIPRQWSHKASGSY